MRDRFSVIGFTEAELGFIAAILLFAALSHQRATPADHRHLAASATPTVKTMPVAEATPVVPLKDYNDLKKKYRDAQQSYAREAAKNQSLQQAYAEEAKKDRALQDQSRHDTDLRSRLAPPCKEKHIATGALADVQVTGSDEFALDGKTYDLDGLLQHFAAQLKQAEGAGCKQVIRVTPGTSISTRDFVTGTGRLKGDFYLDERLAS